MNNHSESAEMPAESHEHQANKLTQSPSPPMKHEGMMEMETYGATLAMDWPLLDRIYVSSAAWLFTFALLFNATAITAGIPQIMKEFDVTITHAIVVFSLFIFGIAFAPLYTPHITERFGRLPANFIGTILGSAFLIGASRSNTIAALAATRFFAGFFQGPVVVLIEGTFADCWPAAFTGSYYQFIGTSQYFGAATGAVLGGTLVHAKDWRWTQYVGLIVNLVALAYAAGMRETFPRSLIRSAALRAGKTPVLEHAPSGEKPLEMMEITVLRPLRMLVSEPLVIGFALSLSLNFGVLFQFFILVPQVLMMLAKFDDRQAGFAFVAAYGGATLALILGFSLDQFFTRRAIKKDVVDIEKRMVGAIVGSIFMSASLFWIGWTSRPGFSYVVPIVGSCVFVWGSMLHVAALVGYLFDAYPPPQTLSALTACAVTRVLSAGWFALFVLTAAMEITGPWLLSTFGFISFALVPVPVYVLMFGKKMRSKSRFGGNVDDTTVGMQLHHHADPADHHPMGA